MEEKEVIKGFIEFISNEPIDPTFKEGVIDNLKEKPYDTKL